MGWFKQIISKVLHKNASAEESKSKALDLLQRGLPSGQVAQQFIMEMSMKDPSFARSPSVMQIMQSKDDPEALSNVISSYGTNQPTTPMVPPVAQTPVEPTLPPASKPPIEPALPPALKPPIEEIVDTEVGKPEVEVVDQIPTGTIPVEGVPAEEEIASEGGETSNEMEPLEPEGQDLLQSFEDRMQQDNEDLQEEEDASSIYKNPTILESFSVPVERVTDIAKNLAPINKRLRGMFHPEIKLEFEGDPYQKPVYYKDGPTNEDFVKVKISGKLPSPTDEIQVRIKEPIFYNKGERAGQPKMEADGVTQATKMIRRDPKGAKIFARVNHHPLKEEEIQYFLKTEAPNSKLRASIESAQAENKVPYYNTITPIGKRYKWDDKFYFSSSQQCFKCKARQSRNQTFIAAIVPPEQLSERTYKGDDGTGNMVDMPLMITRDMNYGVGDADWQQVPAREIPENIMSDKDNPPQQEQIGGSCAESYEEIKIIEALEKKIKGWKQTSQEIDENNAQNTKEDKKPKRKNVAGGIRGSVPSERFFTVAIALLREGADGDSVSRRLPSAASNYLYLIDLQNKGSKRDIDLRRMERLKDVIPKITLDDQKIATDAINWWRSRLGSLGTDEDDKNKINLSILPTIDIGKKRRGKNNPTGRNPNLQRTVEMLEAYLAENNVVLEPYPEEVVPEIEEEIKPGEGVLDDIREVEKGNSFVSKFTHIKSQEYKWKGGVFHKFKDNRGKEYIIFDNYRKDPETNRFIKEPSMNFNQGEEYYIRGKKGDTGRYNTIIENPQIVDQGKLQEYGETKVPEIAPEAAPETILDPELTPEAAMEPKVTTEAIPDVTPEYLPEAAPEAIPEAAPEAPAIPEAAPKPKSKASLPLVTQRAKNVVTTGRDSRGNPMKVESLIPLYVKSLGELVPNLNTQEYTDNLNAVYQRSSREGLSRYIDKIEETLTNYVRK